MLACLRFLLVGAASALAAATALAGDITIHGEQGHSIAEPAGAVVAVGPTISFWQYRNQPAESSGHNGGAQGAIRPGIRYGSDFGYWRGVGRSPFRYWSSEYSKRRFDDLRTPTHRDRFGGDPGRYAPGTRYTTHFGRGHGGFRSTIRYGFR